MLFAGHGEFSDTQSLWEANFECYTPIIETTGRTLSATLAYLAIYQDEQEKAIEEINRVLPDGREMVSIEVYSIHPSSTFLIMSLIVLAERTSSYVFFTTNLINQLHQFLP